MRKVLVFLAITLAFFLAGDSVTHAATYRQKVVTATMKYKPCKELRKSRAGNIAYKDAVSDTYDDGKKRTVKAQIRYVKQTCRNGA